MIKLKESEPILLDDTVTIQQLLSWLGARYLHYYPILTELSGSINSAIMLGHALYWSKHWVEQQQDRDGWFWKSAADWTSATSLSIDEQQTARHRLVAAKLIEECKQGMPRRLYFRVNKQELCQQLSLIRNTSHTPYNSDWTIIQHWLGRPILFFKPLADITNSVSTGLYLSHLLICQRAALLKTSGHNATRVATFSCPITFSQKTLHLGNKAIRTARLKLRTMLLLEELWTSEIPPQQLLRINLEMLKSYLLNLLHKNSNVNSTQMIDSKRMAESAIPGAPNPRYRNGGNVHSSNALFLIQAAPFPPDKYREKGAAIYKEITTYKKNISKQLQPRSSQKQPLLKISNQRHRNVNDDLEKTHETHDKDEPLIFPKNLSNEERQFATQMLARVEPSTHQPILDEWCGQMAAKNLSNRLGYLNGLIQAVQQKRFVPALGPVIAQSRKRSHELTVVKALGLEQAQQEAITKLGGAAVSREEAMIEIRQRLGISSHNTTFHREV